MYNTTYTLKYYIILYYNYIVYIIQLTLTCIILYYNYNVCIIQLTLKYIILYYNDLIET